MPSPLISPYATLALYLKYGAIAPLVVVVETYSDKVVEFTNAGVVKDLVVVNVANAAAEAIVRVPYTVLPSRIWTAGSGPDEEMAVVTMAPNSIRVILSSRST